MITELPDAETLLQRRRCVMSWYCAVLCHVRILSSTTSHVKHLFVVREYKNQQSSTVINVM